MVRKNGKGILRTITKMLLPNNGRDLIKRLSDATSGSKAGRSRMGARAGRSGRVGARRARPRRGKAGGASRNRARRGQGGTIVQSAPLGVSVTNMYGSPGKVNIARSEFSYQIGEAKDLSYLRIVLAAGNDDVFSTLASMAAGYQYFKFSSVSVTYEPVVGNATAGTIVIAPSGTNMTPIYLPQITTLPNAVESSIWKPVSVTFPASLFNQQFSTGWSVVTPSSSIDTGDPTQVQGFIFVGVSDCAANALTTIYGRLQVSYQCELNKVKFDIVGPPMFEKLYSADGTFASLPTGLNATNLTNPYITSVTTGGTTTRTTEIKIRESRHPFLLRYRAVGTAITVLSCANTGATGTLTSLGSIINAAGTIAELVVHYKPDGITTADLTFSLVNTTFTKGSFFLMRVPPSIDLTEAT
jgi:hypothetical protein